MSPHFKVTGPEALLAIAACERTTSLIGSFETKVGQNMSFAYGPIGRLLADMYGEPSSESTGGQLSVEVQRVLTRPGIYRYQCVIQPDLNGVLS